MGNPDVLGESIKKAFQTSNDVWMDLELNGIPDDPMNALYFLRGFNDMPILERRALELTQGRVLDVGAAAGSHSLYLKEAGFDVTSLEQSEDCCEVMRERGLKDVVCENIFEYSSEEKYDTILLLMNGWGMGATLDGMHRLIPKLKSLLNPGGQIIGDTSDIQYWSKEKRDDQSSLSNKYHGEVLFSVSSLNATQTFNWIYPAPSLLQELFENNHLNGTVEAEGPHWDYLIRAQRKS